jgi:hypothetical protein
VAQRCGGALARRGGGVVVRQWCGGAVCHVAARPCGGVGLLCGCVLVWWCAAGVVVWGCGGVVVWPCGGVAVQWCGGAIVRLLAPTGGAPQWVQRHHLRMQCHRDWAAQPRGLHSAGASSCCQRSKTGGAPVIQSVSGGRVRSRARISWTVPAAFRRQQPVGRFAKCNCTLQLAPPLAVLVQLRAPPCSPGLCGPWNRIINDCTNRAQRCGGFEGAWWANTSERPAAGQTVQPGLRAAVQRSLAAAACPG